MTRFLVIGETAKRADEMLRRFCYFLQDRGWSAKVNKLIGRARCGAIEIRFVGDDPIRRDAARGFRGTVLYERQFETLMKMLEGDNETY